MNFTPHSYQIQTLFINVLKTFFFISGIWKLISCLVVRKMKRKEGRKKQGKEKRRKRVVHRRIALNNFFKRKVFFEKIMGPSKGLC